MLRGTLEHPKFLDLQARLDLPRYQVAGLLECLWHFTARYAPAGDVGRWANGAIARALDWDGDADALIEHLTAAGWLEPHGTARLWVHDWHEHADDAVHRQMARKIEHFANGAQPKTTRLAPHERAKVEGEYARRAPNVREHGAPAVRTECAHSASRGRDPRPAPPRPAGAPPDPEDQKQNQSAARRSSAAQGGLDLGPNPKPRRKAAKKPKPSSLAARAFCEEYKAKRGQNPTLSPRVLPDLGKIYEQQGEDLFRRSVRAFLGFDDEWLRVRSWRADAFVRDIERCSVRAQWDLEREQRPAPLEPPERFDDLPEDLQQRGAALFGGADT